MREIDKAFFIRGRHDIPQAARDADADDVLAFAELVDGLQALMTHSDWLDFNFPLAAGEIADDPAAPETIRKMMEFARKYKRFGLEAAASVPGNRGVLVDVISGMDGQPRRVTTGRLVGLVGIERASLREMMFKGVAVVEDYRGRERFVAVSVETNGHTQIHGKQYDYSQPDLLSRKPIESIFPPELK